MNHSILTADRNAHVRMIAASLACAIVFVAAMVGSRVALLDPATVRAAAPLVVKAHPATTMTSHERPSLVR